MNNNANQIKTTGIIAIMLISSLTVMVGTAITPALPELGRIYQLGNYASCQHTPPPHPELHTTHQKPTQNQKQPPNKKPNNAQKT